MLLKSPRSIALAFVAALGAGFLGAHAAHAAACAGRVELEAEYYAFPLPGPAHCVAAGDWNEDGRQDLAVVHAVDLHSDPSLSILFGQGGFRVGSLRGLPLDIAPRWVVAHDMDGDGHQDLVVTGDGGTVILGGDGVGGFREAERFPQTGRRAAVGDVDGDGKPDIALAPDQRPITIILRGTGEVRELPGYSTPVLADFDRDGDLDLATAGTLVWLNDGHGRFSGPSSYPTSCNPGYIAAGDVNGDGNLDLFGASTEPGWGGCDMLLLGAGDGSFRFAAVAGAAQPATDSPPSPRPLNVESDGEPSTGAHPQGVLQSPRYIRLGPEFVVLADFDGDGRADPIRIGGDTGHELNGRRTIYKAQMACVADMDGDGKLDIVVAGDNAVAIHPGNGDGRFRFNPSAWINHRPEDVVLADLDGDGRRDVAMTSFEGELVVALTAPDGGFKRVLHDQIYPNSGSIAIADFDGDGHGDLLNCYGELYAGNGDGTFRTPPNPTGAFGVPGDFDEDGHMDLAMYDSNCRIPILHAVQLFLGNGDGTFRTGPTIPVEALDLNVADMDHDGHMDLVATGHGGTISVVYGRGDGSAAKIVEIPTTFFTQASLGDLDGDGLMDMIAPSSTGTAVYLSRGRTFVRSPYEGAPIGAAVGDLNGDGIADLMAGGVWLGHGDGTFETPDMQFGPGGATLLDDRNGDGLDDVIVAGSYDEEGYDNTLTLIMNRTVPNHAPITAGARASVERTWPPNGEFVDVAIAGVTDPDGDAVTIQCLGVTQDEPVTSGSERGAQRGSAKHESCADAVIAPGGHARVRLTRDGSGNGRVYEIAYSASDGCGGRSLGRVSVCVPHEPGEPCIDDGQRFNSLACGSAFTMEESEASARSLAVERLAPGRWAIRYALAAPAAVQLDVFDVLGRRVGALESGRRPAGGHESVWAPTARSGVYFVRLVADGRVLVRRCVALD